MSDPESYFILFFFNKLRKSGVHPPVQEDQNPQSEYVYVQTSTNAPDWKNVVAWKV